MIKTIYIVGAAGHQRSRVRGATVVAGKGIVGDRNYERADWPGQNVTFIEIEQIDRYNVKFGQEIEEWQFGRNVVTRGVRLNDLVGRTFSIGSAKFRGIELCEPCATLGSYLANESMTARQCVQGLIHRAGLRADVIEDGLIEEGMPFLIDQ